MTKLIFCFDGTANDPNDAGDFSSDSSISNILKMHALFGGGLKNRGAESPETPGQRSFYYSGVGTYGCWLFRKINAAFSPTYWDMDRILKKAASDLNEAFQDGDEVYVFGFSRGAAIARIFAAKIKEEEYCPKVNKVNFLGVFDTVAAIKGSRDLSADTYPASGVLFEDGTLSQHVKKAVHLVAIDEKRKMFQPTLFNKEARVEEVWFAGVHSDIGGGYWFDGLADITLKFMMDKCKEEGLQELPVEKIGYDGFFLTDEKMSEDERLCRDDVEIHPVSYGVLHAQHRDKRVAKLTLAPRTVRVMKGDKIADDMPIVHHTVLERFRKVAGYRPAALRDVQYQVMLENGECEKTSRHGIADMREKS